MVDPFHCWVQLRFLDKITPQPAITSGMSSLLFLMPKSLQEPLASCSASLFREEFETNRRLGIDARVSTLQRGIPSENHGCSCCLPSPHLLNLTGNGDSGFSWTTGFPIPLDFSISPILSTFYITEITQRFSHSDGTLPIFSIQFRFALIFRLLLQYQWDLKRERKYRCFFWPSS